MPPVRRHRPAGVARAGLVAAAALVAATGLAGCAAGTPPAAVTVTPTVVVTVTPSPTPTPTPTVAPPQTWEEALVHLGSATADPSKPLSFVSPSGNLACTIVAGGALRGCELEQGRIAPPTSGFCASAGGGAADIGRIQLGPNGPVAVCNKDQLAPADAPELPYGRSTTSGSVACVSEQIGVTCVDASTRKGFFLARDTYYVF
ncbi:hypothetical protein [Lapillicoccus jejuensis]|uniref:Subtilisin inhibitor-like n=1 Tax=Lapillicoccus jejuensis TaxID=402171 RepID=A0A542E1X8_9MICO|nr:hypothetical protein [Lapillicoccus jejuensis]TQJ09338.1 hypothetical protein FB458_2448 [Lapillicoccus jejuensis]